MLMPTATETYENTLKARAENQWVAHNKSMEQLEIGKQSTNILVEYAKRKVKEAVQEAVDNGNISVNVTWMFYNESVAQEVYYWLKNLKYRVSSPRRREGAHKFEGQSPDVIPWELTSIDVNWEQEVEAVS